MARKRKVLYGICVISQTGCGWDIYETVTFFNFPSVMEVAIILTLGLTGVLVLYTLQSKRDFLSWMPQIVWALGGLCLLMVISVFLPLPEALLGVSLAGVAVCSAVIILFTHLMTLNLPPLDYKMCAIVLCLYTFDLFGLIQLILEEIK